MCQAKDFNQCLWYDCLWKMQAQGYFPVEYQHEKKNPYRADVYSGPCQTSKMELFAKIVNSFLPLTIFKKRFVLDGWQGSEYALVGLNSLYT